MAQGFRTTGVHTMSAGVSGFATRPSLLLRLRDPKDAAAWQAFVEVYGPLVYGHGRRRGLRHEDAEDVTQKVFGRIVDAIRTFTYRPDIGRFRDWLGTIVRNEVNRFLAQSRKLIVGRGGEGGGLETTEAPSADSAWEAEFNARVLEVALDRSRPHFEEATWRAFELVWRQNRPAVEVAQELGQPIDWVYVAKSRVLKRLWQEVQELADDTILAACSFR